jgi:hypothetical protein
MYAVRRGIDPDEGAIEAGSIGRRQRSPVDPGVEPASSTPARRPADPVVPAHACPAPVRARDALTDGGTGDERAPVVG